jgi:hypothetical protein
MSKPAKKPDDLIKDAAQFDAEHNPLHEVPVALTVYEGVPVAKGTVRYLVTSAQNATPVFKEGWESLLQAQMFYKAHLSVINYRYKNPTSRWTGSQNNAEHWAEEVRPFLKNERWDINPNLRVLGDIKIVPTAKDPLQGGEGYTGAESSIIGHPNLAFKTVPVPGHLMAKLMTTTGSITVPNYTDSRAGKQGEFQHVAGAIIVEVEGGKFWLRHLNMNKRGEFIDVSTLGCKLFTPKGVQDAPSPEALVTGDAHVRVIDNLVVRAVKTIIAKLKPKRIFWHDLFDGLTCNPYQRFWEKLAHMKAGKDSVEDEIKEAAEFVVDMTPAGTESVVVDSNHDAFLRKWVDENDVEDVGLNGGFYLSVKKFLWDAAHVEDKIAKVPSPFQHFMKQLTDGKGKNIRYLKEDESYAVKGIECGMHGHLGPNGARGSLYNLVKIGVKFIIGHVHGPGIRFGGYAVGLMGKLRMGYNRGPSNWLQTMCLVHGDPCGGKRQLLTIIDGRPWL